MKKRGLFETNRVVHLGIGDISVGGGAPRRDISPGEMDELVVSVSKYGVLQPLSVRRTEAGFELISGEPRLRAAAMAGLGEVPCIIMDMDEQDSAALVLVDNLRRRGLDFIEEARALSRLINLYGYSQEEAARLIGLSQPAVANKLRLLRLPDSITDSLRAANLTERHARSLIRLLRFGERTAAQALSEIIERGYNVARTDSYIDEIIASLSDQPAPAPEPLPAAAAPPAPSQPAPSMIHGHIRFFVNTVKRGVKLLRKAGIPASCEVADAADDVSLTIMIPKNAAADN
jgi:ParB family chromosome partitioning protein